MAPPAIHRDDRTVLIENASLRWAYFVMSFGLLGVVAYRSYALRESPGIFARRADLCPDHLHPDGSVLTRRCESGRGPRGCLAVWSATTVYADLIVGLHVIAGLVIVACAAAMAETPLVPGWCACGGVVGCRHWYCGSRLDGREIGFRGGGLVAAR